MIQTLLIPLYAIVLFITSFFIVVLLEADTITSEVEERDEWPSLSLIVPAYNEEDTLEMTVDSILEADYPDKEVIVVNDGSEDDTRKIAEEYEEEGDIKLINQENQGKGAALNRGLEEAEGELVGCVDADSVLTEDSLKNIVSEMDSDSAVIASAMKVYSPQNLIEKLQRVEYLNGILMRKILGLLDSIHIAPGPMSIYSREKLEEAGGFDEKSRVEDQEICFRFQENHEKLDHSRKGEVYTVAPDNLKDFYRQRKRWWVGSFENMIKYRHMIFNPEYGDFGMFVVPSKLIQAAIAVIGLGVILYTTLTPLIDLLLQFARIGTEALGFTLADLTLAEVMNFVYWQILSLNFNFLALIGGLTLLSSSIVYLATVHTDESIRDIGLLPIAVYVFWFFMFVGFLSIVSFIKVVSTTITGSEVKW